MKNIYLLIILLNISCWGPFLDEEYVCKERNNYGPDYFSCYLIDSLRDNPKIITEESTNTFLLCLAAAKIDFQRKCGNKSNIKPWWL